MSEPEEMDHLERDLIRAMRRVHPPERLVTSVMLAVEAEERGSQPDQSTWRGRTRGRMWAWLTPPAWAGGVLAATLVLGAIGGEQVHARHRRERAELAQQQFETALRVTDQALDQTSQQLARAGLRFGE